MSYWGNDIVALDDSDFQTDARIGRWIEKVCTSNEAAYLAASHQVNQNRWGLWSCKESVYKVLIKTGVAPFMNAKRIEIVYGESTGEGTQNFIATFERKKFYGISSMNKHWVHSICCDFPLEEQSYHSEILNTDVDTASQELRVKIIEVLKINHQIKVDKIIQSPSNIPTVICINPETEIDLSISHHAPYSAYLFHICQKENSI
ncbi:MAG: phosphopantetheinyl transferase (holo-ACP synthase) [Polaribacter sp.]|jgi:phosphopantetheinyl transferase (holo-ACP synthase)